MTKYIDIEQVNEAIHDQHFEYDWIFHDIEKKEIVIVFKQLKYDEKELVGGFLFLKKWKIPIYEARLIIDEVNDYEMITKGRELFDYFNILRCRETEEAEKIIEIICNLGTVMNIRASRCCISVEIGRKTGDYKKSTTFFMLESEG